MIEFTYELEVGSGVVDGAATVADVRSIADVIAVQFALFIIALRMNIDFNILFGFWTCSVRHYCSHEPAGSL